MLRTGEISLSYYYKLNIILIILVLLICSTFLYLEKIFDWSVIFISMTETQEDTELRQSIQQMPWWNKFTFSVQEASEYFGFSDKKIRKIIDENEDADFILWNGTRPRIKRVLFEQFVNEKLTAI